MSKKEKKRATSKFLEIVGGCSLIILSGILLFFIVSTTLQVYKNKGDIVRLDTDKEVRKCVNRVILSNE